MKAQNLLSIILCSLISVFISCKKIDVTPVAKVVPQITLNYKVSGALEDKPSSISRVAMIMSSSFLKQTNTPDQIQNYNTRSIKGNTGGDHTAPYISITSPSNGSLVSGTLNIQVSASDNSGVAKVELTIDNILAATLSAAPYSFLWNTTGITTGTHSITATATDAAGNKAYYTITVTLNTTINITQQTTSFPSSIKLNMPPVANQGQESTCVPFAVAYAGRGFEQYNTTGASTYSYATNLFSPEYVYNQTKFTSDCFSGTTITTVLDFLQTNGVTTWQTMPYSDINGCGLLPDNIQTAEASNYKISSYIKLANTDMAAIKSRLISNHPLFIRVVVDDVFYKLQPGSIWSNNATASATGHALTICGYDDNKKAYLAVNSWGTGWADAGYCWIDYNFFTSVGLWYQTLMG
jgi:C1A family cysteine protease